MATSLAYPFNSVVLIQFTQISPTGINHFQASGVLIAPDEVLTASHVLTDTIANTAANVSSKNFEITPAYNDGASPYVTAHSVNAHYNYIYDPVDPQTGENTISGVQSEIDYAVIHLDHAFTNIGLMSLVADDPGGAATVAGYPVSAGTNQVSRAGMYTKVPSYSLFTGPDTGGGSSGGPVVVDHGFGPQIAGLVSSGNGTNGFFPIITSSVLAQIETWVAQDDGLVVASKLTDVSGAGFAYDITAYETRAMIGSQPPVVFSDQTPPALSLMVSDISSNLAALQRVAQQFSIDLGTVGAITSAATVKAVPIGGSTDVSAVQFADGRLVYDASDAAAKIQRLYGAAFGRAGDERGLTAWTAQLQGGTSEGQIGNAFVSSAEFQARYGASVSDNAFVTQLYANVLNRAPDAFGLAAWDGRLASGESRGDVVTGFSESSEYIGATAATDQAGIFVLDAAAPEVARLYEAVLGRLPDAAGIRFFDDSIDHAGTSLADVAKSMMASPEYQSNFGKLSTSDFVTTLYATTLHRAPDAAGAAGWNNALNTGALTRAQVAVGFSESVEHSLNSANNVFGATPTTYGVKLA